MHPSAMTLGKLVFEHYVHSPEQVIVEIGSQLVNGGLRDIAPPHNRYIGLDFVSGPGVDLVLDDPYRYPLEDNTADLVVSSSVFEHAEFFWLSFLEALRILKDGGVLYLNVPACGYFHRFPQDCWRFYPDAANALCRWGRRSGYSVSLLETFTANIEKGVLLNDVVMLFVKGAMTTRPRISEYIGAYNIGIIEEGLVQDYAGPQVANQVERFFYEFAKGHENLRAVFPKKATLNRHNLSTDDVHFLFDYFIRMELLLKEKEF